MRGNADILDVRVEDILPEDPAEHYAIPERCCLIKMTSLCLQGIAIRALHEWIHGVFRQPIWTAARVSRHIEVDLPTHSNDQRVVLAKLLH